MLPFFAAFARRHQIGEDHIRLSRVDAVRLGRLHAILADRWLLHAKHVSSQFSAALSTIKKKQNNNNSNHNNRTSGIANLYAFPTHKQLRLHRRRSVHPNRGRSVDQCVRVPMQDDDANAGSVSVVFVMKTQKERRRHNGGFVVRVSFSGA